jgi:hypothetical protein
MIMLVFPCLKFFIFFAAIKLLDIGVKIKYAYPRTLVETLYGTSLHSFPLLCLLQESDTRFLKEVGDFVKPKDYNKDWY